MILEVHMENTANVVPGNAVMSEEKQSLGHSFRQAWFYYRRTKLRPQATDTGT